MVDVVSGELVVGGDDRQPFTSGLSDEEPVEGVAVMVRQVFDGADVRGPDRKRPEPKPRPSGSKRHGFGQDLVP